MKFEFTLNLLPCLCEYLSVKIERYFNAADKLWIEKFTTTLKP